MIRNIITDLAVLRKPVAERPLTQEEIDNISLDLLDSLNEHGGIGLSANQIGIDARMCIIHVKDPIVLVNPKIMGASDNTTLYAEGCLSIKKSIEKNIITQRFYDVMVKTDNYPEDLQFKPDAESSDGHYKYEDKTEFLSDIGLLESICVQHEIDHLNGFTINERRFYKPRRVKKYGRNELVMIQDPESGDQDFLKYKKAENKLASGWIII